MRLYGGPSRRRCPTDDLRLLRQAQIRRLWDRSGRLVDQAVSEQLDAMARVGQGGESPLDEAESGESANHLELDRQRCRLSWKRYLQAGAGTSLSQVERSSGRHVAVLRPLARVECTRAVRCA